MREEFLKGNHFCKNSTREIGGIYLRMLTKDTLHMKYTYFSPHSISSLEHYFRVSIIGKKGRNRECVLNVRHVLDCIYMKILCLFFLHLISYTKEI